jgi:phenylpropionate dioxygenase-like ring-hydroxylating dioxygenase large terminal subunit
MLLKDCWYVAAWSHEVDKQGMLARTILSEPVLLMRDEAGRVVALHDRCAHRGAPLSAGRREGDAVRCLYHGLKFASSGQCVEIPGQDRVPAKACVRTFPIVERSQWVWIWMGDPANADESAIPDTHWLDDPGWRYKPGYIHYHTNYLLIADNLLDFSHLPYVHPTTLGGVEDYAQNPAKVERHERGVRVTRWCENITAPPVVTKVTGWTEPVDRWNIYDFVAPGILLMDSGSQPVGTGAREGRREGAVQFRSCQALTPETEHSTHYFFSFPHNFSLDDPSVTERLHQDVLVAFEEDRVVINGQQRILDLDPDFEMLPLGMDAALLHFRHVMQQLIDGQASQPR